MEKTTKTSGFIIYKTGDAALHQKIGHNLMRLPDGEYIISWKKNRNVRSLPQLRLAHVICKIYAIYTGHTLEEIKDEFKRERFYEIRTDKQGKEFKRLKSFSKDFDGRSWDTLEMTSLVNNLLDWGNTHHPLCVVPRKEDIHYQMLMEIENDYEVEFSGL